MSTWLGAWRSSKLLLLLDDLAICRGGASGWRLIACPEYLLRSEVRCWTCNVWTTSRVHQRRRWRPLIGSSTATWPRRRPRRWKRSSRPLERARLGSCDDARPPPRSHRYVGFGCLLLCNIVTKGILLGWSSYECVRSAFFDTQWSALYVCLSSST